MKTYRRTISLSEKSEKKLLALAKKTGLKISTIIDRMILSKTVGKYYGQK